MGQENEVSAAELCECLKDGNIPVVEIKLCFPVLRGNGLAATRINRFYRLSAQQYLKALKRQALPRNREHLHRNLEQGRAFTPAKASLEFRVTRLSADLLSVRSVFRLREPGSPPSEWIRGDVWDRSSGWPLTLRDLLPAGTSRKKRLLDLALTQASERGLARNGMERRELMRRLRNRFNSDHIWLSEDNLVLGYAPGDLMDPSYGAQEFVYPWSAPEEVPQDGG